MASDPAIPTLEELGRRLRQQELVAGFGRFALRHDDLQMILDESCAVAADGLYAHFAKVLQFDTTRGDFIVCAGLGWKPGIVGHARLGGDSESPAGYAFKTGEAVISNQLVGETRFRTPDLLLEHGIHRAINVLIGEHPGHCFGVLEVDSQHEGDFSRHDIAFLQGLANTLATAVDKQERVEAVAGAVAIKDQLLHEKDLLMQEVHHRVKNGLQLVQNLLSLQARAARDSATADVLGESAARVHTIGAIHDRLYRPGTALEVEVQSYLAGLIDDLRGAMASALDGRTITLDASPVVWPAAEATTLGLVLTELVTNALKYGAGSVRVSFREASDGQATLDVEDEGPGVPAGFDPAKSRGLGMRIVTGLLRPRGGGLDILGDGGKNCFRARFPRASGPPPTG